MINNIFSDRCNMTNEYYSHRPLHPLETKLNIVLAKNPQLLDENKDNILIKKNLIYHLIYRLTIISIYYLINVYNKCY